MANNRKIKKFRWFISYMKELDWLEDMALSGWRLHDIRFGVCYYFETCDPIRLFYEIDRFDVPINPTLKEIRNKELFIGVAQDMGWSVVTHDESQNYYFCKEYSEGEINEIYNDEESREQRAKKYQELFGKKALDLIKILFFVSIMFLALSFAGAITGNKIDRWANTFFMLYVFLVLISYFLTINLGKKYYFEFMRIRKDDLRTSKQDARKTVRKLIFTNIRLKKYLSDMAVKGWQLECMTATRFFFVKEALANEQYTMDSKYLTNKRRKLLGKNKLKDMKDWIGMNNDWQVQSLEDAESKGWIFVCALENRLVIYRNNPNEMPQPLNDLKYDRRLRLISMIGWYSAFLVLCGLIGGLVGGIVGAMIH